MTPDTQDILISGETTGTPGETIPSGMTGTTEDIIGTTEEPGMMTSGQGAGGILGTEPDPAVDPIPFNIIHIHSIVLPEYQT